MGDPEKKVTKLGKRLKRRNAVKRGYSGYFTFKWSFRALNVFVSMCMCVLVVH